MGGGGERMTHKRGPFALDNCNLWLWTPTVWRKWPKKKFANTNISNWVSVFVSFPSSLPQPHHHYHPLLLSLPWYSIFLSWVLLLSMDRNDKQQVQLQHHHHQQLSLANCARQQCNEWFVTCMLCKFECLIHLNYHILTSTSYRKFFFSPLFSQLFDICSMLWSCSPFFSFFFHGISDLVISSSSWCSRVIRNFTVVVSSSLECCNKRVVSTVFICSEINSLKFHISVTENENCFWWKWELFW